MRLIRTKKFPSFIDGKHEILNMLPMSEICYFELAQCDVFEDTYPKLNIHDIYITVERLSDGFLFKVIFDIDAMRYIQQLFTINDWDIDENNCVGLSTQDFIRILNNMW